MFQAQRELLDRLKRTSPGSAPRREWCNFATGFLLVSPERCGQRLVLLRTSAVHEAASHL